MLYRRHHKQNKVEKSVPKEPAFSDFPKHTGGGWYELSNGDKVQGKDEAKEAEKEVGD
jgi:hypothetical protein